MFCEQVWHTVPTTCADMYRETSWCDVHVIWSEELYQLRLREECQDPAADSPYTADPIWVTSGRALPAENVENLTAFPFLAGHNVSVALDWDAGEANDCVFTGWELELRPADGEWFLAEECISSLYEDVNCTVTEGLQSETTYDTRVRSYCLDLLSKGNWTEVLELAGVLSLQYSIAGRRQMRFSMEPQDPWDCAFVAYVGELSEAFRTRIGARPTSLGCACQLLELAQSAYWTGLDLLMSNTTYKAEVCAEAMNTTLTLNPDAVRSVQVVFRSETHARVNFLSGDQPGDCNAEDWLFEYYNESWQFAAFCTRVPGARRVQQCHLELSMLDEEREYWMRVQELCVGGLQAPRVNFTLPAWEAEKDVSNMSNRSNMSEMEEEEDEWWESNYSNYSMENVTMMNMTGHMDMGMNMSENNMSEPNMSEPSMTEMNMSMAEMNASDSNMSEMQQPEMNETPMNESDVGGYAADMNDTDTDENDTDVNDSEMNETDMAEWENSSYENGSNDSQDMQAMSASCSQELLSLLGRVDALAILASAALSEVALQLKVAMEGRGCAVAAAVEGCSRVEPPRVRHVQVVLILGDSPKDPDAFNPQGKLGAAAGLAFAAIASGAPVRALGGTTGLEDVRSLIEDLKQHPLPSAVESQHRWAETLAAALADDAEQLEDSLESWPELLVCRDSTGDTLLHRVASAGALEAACLLIERGADANLRNGDEATAGDLAFRAGRQTVFEALVMHRVSCIRREQEPQEPPLKRQTLEAPDHYLKQDLRYEDKRLLDANSKAVMMGWEEPLMKRHAELLLPAAGLRVANVGFGLGLVDGFLSKRGPSEHHIIEAHKDVLAEMKRRGWHEQPGVFIHEGRWQEIIPKLKSSSLDAIFFDTWSETYEDLRQFQEELPRLLAPGGAFSFFNGMAPYSIAEHAAFCRLAQEDLHSMGLPCDICKIELGGLGDETWHGVAERYWQFDSYYLPLARKASSPSPPTRELSEAAWPWRLWPQFPVSVGDELGKRLPRTEFGLSD
ncbi:rmt2 [Symbiodinium necroappetens]|uniref:Rmt2 protein n=1 Tax=Symbiodinium necroappetens TaxID=1628268 RepID=A0A813C6D1_9DINO|nr:rmt2 [Symbiodinium necroappetens]